MPLPVFTIAPIDGAGQPGQGAIIFARHEFRAGADGQLEHYTDGILRAQVPPEGWPDYANDWPGAEGLIAAMRAPTAVLDAIAAPSEGPGDVEPPLPL